MTTVTIKGFIHKESYGDGLLIFPSDMTEFGYLLVGTYEFEYEIPAGFNAVAAEVACLKKKLDKINKEHTDHVRTINQRINDLLCIENKPSQTADDMPDEVLF